MNASKKPAADEMGALRILVYGPPGSGKSTTIEGLGTSLGQAVTPYAGSDDLLYFEWMEYEGGRHDGRPIETKLIAISSGVPARVRRRALRLSHVVLFVADTSAAGLEGTQTWLAEVQEVLSELPEPRPPIVFQANKRDDDGAITIERLRSLLGVDESEVVVETVATTGDGVRQAFVYAVRTALEQLAALNGKPGDTELPTKVTVMPDELLAALQQLRHGEEAMATSPSPVSESEAFDIVDRRQTSDESPSLSDTDRNGVGGESENGSVAESFESPESGIEGQPGEPTPLTELPRRRDGDPPPPPSPKDATPFAGEYRPPPNDTSVSGPDHEHREPPERDADTSTDEHADTFAGENAEPADGATVMGRFKQFITGG